MEQASVTVQDLDNLIKKIAEQRQKIEQQKAVLTELNKEATLLETQAAGYLKELERDNYKSPHGTIYTVRKWQYALPKTPEDKQAFFEWLKERGAYDQYVTVNHNSFTALCNQEREAAASRGELITIPGVAPGTLFETTQFRQS